VIKQLTLQLSTSTALEVGLPDRDSSRVRDEVDCCILYTRLLRQYFLDRR
jgi:hypothetical protein